MFTRLMGDGGKIIVVVVFHCNEDLWENCSIEREEESRGRKLLGTTIADFLYNG